MFINFLKSVDPELKLRSVPLLGSREYVKVEGGQFSIALNFNTFKGPVHWELLLKARALDNQLFCASVSPARDENADYIAWGHSSIANPWGDVISKAGHQEEIIYADIDLTKMAEVRQQIPMERQRRFDLYKTIKL